MTQENRVDINTFNAYCDIAYKDIIPYFQAHPIKLVDLKPMHLDQYYDHLMTQRKGKGGKDAHLSVCTVKKHHTNIHKCLKYAVKNDMIPKNPADHIEKLVAPKDLDLKKQKRSENVYNAEQLKHLLQVIKTEALCPIITFISQTGVRREEALGLRWRSVDLEKRKFTIENVIVQVGGKVVEKHSTKTPESCRTLELSDELTKLLISIKQKQEQDREIFGNTYIESDLVFTWPNGRWIRPDYVTHKFSKIIQKNGLPHLTVHGLRHTFGSILSDAGVPTPVISEWLGHSRVDTTQRIYIHRLSDKPFKEITKTISTLLDDKEPKNILDTDKGKLT